MNSVAAPMAAPHVLGLRGVSGAHLITILVACCMTAALAVHQPEYQNLTLPCTNSTNCATGQSVGAPLHWTAADPSVNPCSPENVPAECAPYTELLEPLFVKHRNWRAAGGVQAHMLRNTWEECVQKEMYCIRIRIHDGQIFVWDSVSKHGFDSTRPYSSVLMFMRMAYR